MDLEGLLKHRERPYRGGLDQGQEAQPFAANAFALSWHVKLCGRGVGGEANRLRRNLGREVKEWEPILSATRQSSFALSWVLSLKTPPLLTV
jgi:hypothetical protein